MIDLDHWAVDRLRKMFKAPMMWGTTSEALTLQVVTLCEVILRLRGLDAEVWQREVAEESYPTGLRVVDSAGRDR